MKNKQLRKWALGAEIISAFAVVVTIGFLAVQTMDTTNALQTQTFQALMHDTNEWRASIVSPDMADLRVKWRDQGFESLSKTEQYRIRTTNLVLWGIYESAYFANERGVLGSIEWSRFEVAICRSRKQDIGYWELEGLASFSVLLTPQFMEYIQQTCD
jgi:hypothetical protein